MRVQAPVAGTGTTNADDKTREHIKTKTGFIVLLRTRAQAVTNLYKVADKANHSRIWWSFFNLYRALRRPRQVINPRLIPGGSPFAGVQHALVSRPNRTIRQHPALPSSVPCALLPLRPLLWIKARLHASATDGLEIDQWIELSNVPAVGLRAHISRCGCTGLHGHKCGSFLL